MSNRVLIVDDDRAIAQLTSIWLRSAGYETKLCYDGHEALRVASSWRPDAMLLDIRMPDLDGFEVYARMRDDAALRDIPVIYLSANVQDAARKEAAAVGAAAFLAKPYEPDHVLRVVDRTIAPHTLPTGQESHHE